MIKHAALRTLWALALLATVMTTSPAVSATPKVIYARTAVGIIYSIDMAKRTAMISGYRYYFGDPRYGDATKVTLYQLDTGSFDMLKVGMKVYMRYAEYGVGRYVLSLKQLAPDTNIYARGIKVDP